MAIRKGFVWGRNFLRDDMYNPMSWEKSGMVYGAGCTSVLLNCQRAQIMGSTPIICFYIEDIGNF